MTSTDATASELSTEIKNGPEELSPPPKTLDKDEQYELSGPKLGLVIAGLSASVFLMAIDTSIIATVCKERSLRTGDRKLIIWNRPFQ
jgi:hypothetical protein